MTSVVRSTFTTPKHSPETYRQQSGIALIFLVLVVGLVATGIIIGSLNGNSFLLKRNQADSDQLLQAKMALLAYAVSASGAGQRPGDLVRPDILSDANYDGATDSGCLDVTKANGLPSVSSGANMRCLGRFPWKDLGFGIESSSENDSDGRIPWLAVSANLVDPACLVTLNSDTLSLPYNGYACNNVSVPHPWLTVRDALGNVLSNRVAAVILIPGLPVGNQSRPVSPNLGNASQYLDSVTVVDSADCTAPHVAGTYTNSGLNNEFIAANDTKQVSDADPCYQHPYQFNDKLIYITIEELMAEVEKRVAGEIKKALNTYYVASDAVPGNRYYPYAANLGDTSNACQENQLNGFIPLFPANASTTNNTCNTVFSTITRVEFTNSSGLSYTSRTGYCTRIADICRCTGAGSCTKASAPTTSFTCDSSGFCLSTESGTFDFYYNAYSPDVTVTSGACIFVPNSGQVTCTGDGTFLSANHTCSHPNPGLTGLPQWFKDNQWEKNIFYAVDNTCTYANPGCNNPSITVGARTSVNALLITSGRTLPTTEAQPAVAQNRPSASILDYLDSNQNTNGNAVYDAVGTKRTNSYNDQMFIVAP